VSSPAVPVTVVSALSRTSREQLVDAALREHRHVLAVVYDVEPGGADVRVVRRMVDYRGLQHQEVVELAGCCLACTVRADVGPALELGLASGRWREVVLALPAAVTARSIATAVGERDDAYVDTLTTVVDGCLLQPDLSGDVLLAEGGLAAAPADRRSTAQLLAEQVEDADVLAVTGLHRMATEDARRAQALLSHLAPLALQVLLAEDLTGAGSVIGTGRFDGSCRPVDRERLTALASGLCPPSCGVTTVVWQADAALHPGRLSAALPSLLGPVLRSRGWITLAGRDGQRVRWESAGGGLSFGDPVADPTATGCHLVLTGTDVAEAELVSSLDACLAEPGESCEDDPFAGALAAGPR